MGNLLPLLAPVLVEIWNVAVYPELQKLEGQIKSEDLKLVADAFLAAINKIAAAEIPKI